MEKAADAIRCYSHCLAMFLQKTIQSAIVVPIQQRFGLQALLVPAADHLRFAQLGNLEVSRVDVYIADDLYLRDRLK
jgi:hypothetical protein